MDKASNKEPAGCDIGIIFEMEEDSYTPDPGKFILRSEMKAGDDKCLIYAAEDEEVTPCLVVYKIKDASEISKAEVSFSNDKNVTSKFIDFGDEVKGFYPTSLQNAEFPGTFGITITDKNGEELGGIGFSLG